jgi:hypothetical protein
MAQVEAHCRAEKEKLLKSDVEKGKVHAGAAFAAAAAAASAAATPAAIAAVSGVMHPGAVVMHPGAMPHPAAVSAAALVCDGESQKYTLQLHILCSHCGLAGSYGCFRMAGSGHMLQARACLIRAFRQAQTHRAHVAVVQPPALVCFAVPTLRCAGNGRAVKAGSKKVRKPAIVPSNISGPTGPSAAVAAVLEGHGVLMGTSVDDNHLIHKPTKGMAAGDLTGAMHVTDALHFGGFHGHHGHNSPMVSLRALLCCMHGPRPSLGRCWRMLPVILHCVGCTGAQACVVA